MPAKSMPKPLELRADVPTPLHHQLYVVLRQQIAEGRYPPDQPLPSELTLTQMFGVSRITVRRALDRLAAEGFVSRRRGKRTHAQPVITPPPIRANLRGVLENLLAMGLKTRVTLVEFDYVAATEEIARQLEIPPGTVVQKAVRVRAHQGVPFSHLTTHVPEDIGRSYRKADLAQKPLLLLLERAGVRVSHADQTITARLADSAVAPLLRIEIGAALLCVRRLVRDQNDRPVEYLQALYRPDVYEYQMTMSRVTNSQSSIWTPNADATTGL